MRTHPKLLIFFSYNGGCFYYVSEPLSLSVVSVITICELHAACGFTGGLDLGDFCSVDSRQGAARYLLPLKHVLSLAVYSASSVLQVL